MNAIGIEVKRETIRLVYSLISLIICIAVLWFVYPKLIARGGTAQARSYWKAEREANERRLFGGEGDDAV